VATRRTLLSAMLSAGVFLVMPAFVTAFGHIAWTRYAERYLYMPTAYVIISIVVSLRTFVTIQHDKVIKYVTLVLLGIMFVVTLERSFIWQNDLLLSKDTVEKSPMSREARLAYGTLLSVNGNYDEALKQLEEGKLLPFIGYDERFDLEMANVYYKRGRYDDTERACKIALDKSHGTSRRALIYLVELTDLKMKRISKHAERYSLNKIKFEYKLKLYKLDRDPHLLYDLGVTAEELGEQQQAYTLYRQAVNNLTDTDQYKKMAQMKLNTLTRAKVNEDTSYH
jgi:hypothetical protein